MRGSRRAIRLYSTWPPVQVCTWPTGQASGEPVRSGVAQAPSMTAASSVVVDRNVFVLVVTQKRHLASNLRDRMNAVTVITQAVDERFSALDAKTRKTMVKFHQ